jgi:pimeloyl-ACP methyl ester carboxylesterase
LLASRLRRAGYPTLNVGYPSWRWSADRIVDHLHPHIARFADGLDGPLHYVGHSMGGLILRAYLTRHRPERLGRVVMLGTPNSGSEMAERLYQWRLHRLVLNQAGGLLRTQRPASVEAAFGTVDYALGVIAGDRPLNARLPDLIFRAPNDGKVSVMATHVEGQSDHLVMPVAHTAMIYTRPVVDQVIHFLREGCFDRGGRK